MGDWRVGEIVALVSRDGSSNGSGDGILWRVIKVTAPSGNNRPIGLCQLRVEPAWTATGSTALKPRTIYGYNVAQRFNFARLGELRMQLDELCRGALAIEAGIPPEEDADEEP